MRPVYNDELYHYGKLGMKWGHRIKQTITDGISERKAFNKEMKTARRDQLLHPIHSTKAQIALIKKNPKAVVWANSKDIKALNADVKNRVADSKAKKTNHVDSGKSLVSKMLNNPGVKIDWDKNK